jgi:3-oxoacyl-[acyl-carrier protein] reductase
MSARRRLIINIASTAGVRRASLTWYNGSKGAVITLTKSMAVELAPKNIRVNAINPVMGETGMLTQFMGLPDTPENRAKFLAGIPLGRLSRPHDIANAALFLAEPASAFITGVALDVDGGRHRPRAEPKQRRQTCDQQGTTLKPRLS